MFLSFIVPVYNVEKFLPECLESLLNQDISREEYEIICVNDGSADGSLEILRQYEKKYANIRVLNQENSGVSFARNAGMAAAKGDYIWLVDSDDLIAHDFLGCVYAITQNDSPDMIDFGAYSFREEMTEEEKTAYFRGSLPATSFANHVYVTRSVYKRDFLLRNHVRFDAELSYSEDSLFNCECLLAKPSVIHLDKMGYLFRYRSGSATTLASTSAIKRKFHSYRTAALRFWKYYFEVESEQKGPIADLLMANMWQAMYLLVGMPFAETKKYLKELHGDGLFPFTTPEECSLRRSYQTDRTDIVGKVFDKVYINMHRPWGFVAMKLLRFVIDAKKKLVK